MERADRRCNRLQARRRIIVERILSRVKQYQLLAPVYRHRIADDNRRFRHVAALTHCRLAPTLA